MQHIDIFTAAVAFLAGGLVIHFFGVRRTRVRTLEKALQESCLKYALQLEKGRKELEEFRGERLVLKNIKNADTKRAEKLIQENDRVKAKLALYRIGADESYQLATALRGFMQLGNREMYDCSKTLYMRIQKLRDIGG